MRTLGILLLTYNRYEYAHRTLHKLFENMIFDGIVHLHIASDGDDSNYINKLVELAYSCNRHYIRYELGDVSTSNSERRGYGANYNLGTQQLHQMCDYILPLEDDWECVREFNANLFIEVFEDLRVGCVRMGYIGYTQQLKGEFISVANKHWLLLDPDSPEPHVFAGHPRIERVSWSRKVGEWPEGELPGRTEFLVSHRAESRQGVVWPCDLITPTGNLFVHIGAERSY